MGQKRPREASSIITRRAEIFEDLANVDQNIRLNAARALLTDIVPQANCDQLQEVLRRLIRGLCSGRKAARLGFSVALTELLSTFHRSKPPNSAGFQDIRGVIDTLVEQTQTSGGIAGQEGRDHCIGRLFGAEAIIKSRILFQGINDSELCGKILDIVYDLAKEKSWLREQCGFVLYQSLECSPTLAYIQTVIDKLRSAGLAKTPEGVAIWIAIQKQFPSVTVPNGVWHNNTPLHQKEKSQLALILKEASVSELDVTESDARTTQRGSWSANVHFAWLVVITELLSQSGSKHTNGFSQCLSFSEFWNNCVEDGLFKSKSSDERKYWGLTLFQRGLNIASTPDAVASLFTKKLVQCLSNHLASSERYLHRAAERARKAVLEKVETSPDMRIMILQTLLMNGSVDFDKASKTRTIEEMLVGLDESSTTRICVIYNTTILRPGVDDQRSAAQRRQVAADQLFTALKRMNLDLVKAQPDESSQRSIQKILSLLARFAYFDPGSLAKPEFSSASHDLFRNRLSSSLSYLVANAKDPSIFTYSLMPVIAKSESIPKDFTLLLEVEDAVQELLDRTADTMHSIFLQIDGKSAATRRFYKSALLLMTLTFLQVYNNDLDAVGMLEELTEAFSKKRLKHYEEQGFTSSSALVEILLGLVARPSKLFRRVAQQVFESIAADVEEAGMESMLRILKTKESREGQDALFDHSGGDEGNGQGVDEEHEAHDSYDDASDVIVSDGKILQHEGPESESPDETASSSHEDEEDEDGLDEDLVAFNAKLAQALGTHPGNEDLDAEDSDASDQDMNDEQMQALDKHLENVFRERKKVAVKKTETKDAKKTIIDFKCRVLELLEIFVKKQHQNALALLLISPLLTLLRTTFSPQVSQKAGDLLREYTRLCKGKGLPAIENVHTIIDLLEFVHGEALIQGPHTHTSGCSQASLLLAKVLANHDMDLLDQVVDIYSSTFSASQKKAIADQNFKVKMSFFTDFNNWVSSLKK